MQFANGFCSCLCKCHFVVVGVEIAGRLCCHYQVLYFLIRKKIWNCDWGLIFSGNKNVNHVNLMNQLSGLLLVAFRGSWFFPFRDSGLFCSCLWHEHYSSSKQRNSCKANELRSEETFGRWWSYVWYNLVKWKVKKNTCTVICWDKLLYSKLRTIFGTYMSSKTNNCIT